MNFGKELSRDEGVSHASAGCGIDSTKVIGTWSNSELCTTKRPFWVTAGEYGGLDAGNTPSVRLHLPLANAHKCKIIEISQDLAESNTRAPF